MVKDVVIIGGGIIGLCSAYYLNKAGHNVTILDKSEQSTGCSFGNAGMIVPSHFIPLASPGMISKGIRWMFNSESPFYVKPKLNFDLIKWGWEFYKHSNEKHVKNSAHPLKQIHFLSKSLYHQLSQELPFDFGYHERGLLMLYQTSSAEKEERETAHMANDIGIEARVLKADEVQQLEPDVKVKVRGGIYFPGDAHLTPQTLVTQFHKSLVESGVKFIHEEVVGFEKSNKSIKTVKTVNQNINCDELIIASGIWSSSLAKELKLNLPMQAGKGYSFTINAMEKNTRIPSIFLEARVAVTPMGNSLRFGGTMEIAGINSEINMNRVKGIYNSINQYYPDLKIPFPKKEEVWFGLRPCPPDGLPYLGRLKNLDNTIIATGHSMMGLSLGPATGKLVQQITDEESTSIEIRSFNPVRFA